CPAVTAQAAVSAVTTSRAAVMGKASANVSSMGMPLISKLPLPPHLCKLSFYGAVAVRSPEGQGNLPLEVSATFNFGGLPTADRHCRLLPLTLVLSVSTRYSA